MMQASVLTIALLVIGAAAPEGSVPDGPTEDRRRVPAYTDADLAAYADRRRKEGRDRPDLEAPPPPPAVAPTSPPSRVVQTEPLHIVIDDVLGSLPASEKERAEQIAERIAEFYESSLSGTVRIRLRYFLDKGAFQEAIQQAYGRPFSFSGFYAHDKEIVVGPGERHFKILIHETSHFLADQSFNEVPRWLDEGLAEYFAEASLDPAGLRIRLPGDRQARLGRWKESGRQPGLKELFRLSTDQVFEHDKEGSYLIRDLSWSIVDLLTSSEEGTRLLRRFVKELQVQNPGRDPYDAMIMAYDGGIQGFEAAWLKHVERRLAGK